MKNPSKTLKKKIQEKAHLSAVQIDRQAHTIRTRYLVATPLALGILAKRYHIPITKYFLQEDLNLISTRIASAAPAMPQTVPKNSRSRQRLLKASEYDDVLVADLMPPGFPAAIGQMQDAYAYVFIIENSLRTFVDTIMKKACDKGWWSKVKPQTQQLVASRQKKEKHNTWAGQRGSHEIFYCDIDDLRNIITGHPREFDGLFREVTDGVHWLVGRISEIAHIRNSVAHNCLMSKSNVGILHLYCGQITTQLQTILSSVP